MQATELHLPGHEAKHLGKLLTAMARYVAGGTRVVTQGVALQAADERTLRLTAADGFVLMQADFMFGSESHTEPLTAVLAGVDEREHCVIPTKHAIKGAIDLGKHLQAVRLHDTYTLGLQRLASGALWMNGATSMPHAAPNYAQLLADARANGGTEQFAVAAPLMERAMRAMGAVGDGADAKVRFISTHKSSAAYLTASYDSGYRIDAECAIMPMFVQW